MPYIAIKSFPKDAETRRRAVEKVNEAMRGYDELFRNPVPDRKQEDMQDTPLRLVHPDTQ